MRFCQTCSHTKPINEFNKRSYICILCDNYKKREESKILYENTKQKIKEYSINKYILFNYNNMAEQNNLEIKTLIGENDIKKHNKDADVWESCCLRTDRHMMAYIGQFIFSMSVLGFCTIMIIRANGDCNNTAPYVSIISFLMGKILSSVVSSG